MLYIPPPPTHWARTSAWFRDHQPVIGLVCGIAGVVFGCAEAFAGRPTDRALAEIGVAILGVVAGVGCLFGVAWLRDWWDGNTGPRPTWGEVRADPPVEDPPWRNDWASGPVYSPFTRMDEGE